MPEVRLTGTVTKVLAALQRAGEDGSYGREIAEDASVSRTTIYDVLARIERAGWATSAWEDIEPSEEKRPRRRVYRLTGAGEQVALQTIEADLRAIVGARAMRRWISVPHNERA
jgi:PadR family transcriptional regulator, regulatory protein PadR